MTGSTAKGLVVTRDGARDGFFGGAEGPACLLPVANRPLICSSLDAMRDAGIEEVGVLVGDRSAEEVERAVGDGAASDVRVTYLRGKAPTDLVGALEAAEAFLSGSPCVVHRGDGLLRDGFAALLDEFVRDGLDGLVLLRPGPRGDLTLLPEPQVAPVGEPDGAALAGLQFVGPSFLAAARRSDRSTLEGLLASGTRLRMRELDGQWWGAGSPDGLLEVNRMVLDEITADHGEAKLIDSDIQGRVVLGAGATLECTTVRGPVVIGAGARLRHAYIGPYTSLGERVEVEGAEIEHSVILPGASIKHLGRRLEASLVGRDAKIYRDFVLPRALRLRVADRAEVSLT